MTNQTENTSHEAVRAIVYTVSDVMRLLAIKKSTAYALCVSGEFPVKRVGRSVRVDKKDFDKWYGSL